MIAHLASEVDRGDILNARSRDRYTKMQGAELRNTIWHFVIASSVVSCDTSVLSQHKLAHRSTDDTARRKR